MHNFNNPDAAADLIRVLVVDRDEAARLRGAHWSGDAPGFSVPAAAMSAGV